MCVNSGSSDVSFFKNNSQPGIPNFTIAAKKAVNNYSTGVAIDDLDGDGKPDVVVANLNARAISIFRNTSANNQINFDDAITYAIGEEAYNIAIADFNGDGKPDIAVTSNDSFSRNIYVFTNTTASGSPIAFSAPKSFPMQLNSRGINIADIDLDGKPDMLVASQSGVISIFRNLSTTTNINFAARVNFNMPTGSSPESIVVIDFDKDLKPDIAVANNNSPGTISILKNSSTAGNISFLTRRDFTSNTNPFSICAGDINGDGKVDIAVTNQTNNSVSVLINASTSGSISFNTKLDFGTGNYPKSSSVADVDGDSKPDIIIGNSNDNTISVLLANAQKLPSIITFPPPAVINIDSDNILHPGATSTNTETPITYTSSNPAVAYVGTDGQIHVIAPGITTITASQIGNANYNAATPLSEVFTITQDQHISFPAIPVKIICDADFSANAISSNSLIPLTYTSSNQAVATVSTQGVIHIISAGTTKITVSQNGNILYNPAAPQSQVLTVNIPDSPIVTIAPDHPSVCVTMPVTLTATISNSSANFSYKWLVNGINTGTNSPTFTTTSAVATDVFQCIVTNTSCASVGISNSYTGIIVKPYVTPSIVITSSSVNPVCKNASMVFLTTITNGGINPTYQWRINGTNVGTNSETLTYSNFNDGDIVTCTLTNNNSTCLTATTVTSNAIEVHVQSVPGSLPSVKVTASANNVFAGTTIMFNAIIENAGIVNNYHWQINGINVGENNNVFSSAGLKNGDLISCIVTTNIACAAPVSSNSLKMNILPPPTIDIPNTFTPNGDGINDIWSIPALTNYPDCLINIYNRYGDLLYQSKGYNIAWDGNVNGKPLPTSTYYYVIEIRSQNKKLRGSLTIIR